MDEEEENDENILDDLPQIENFDKKWIWADST